MVKAEGLFIGPINKENKQNKTKIPDIEGTPCQVSGTTWSLLRLAGPVSVYYNRMRQRVWSASYPSARAIQIVLPSQFMRNVLPCMLRHWATIEKNPIRICPFHFSGIGQRWPVLLFPPNVSFFLGSKSKKTNTTKSNQTKKKKKDIKKQSHRRFQMFSEHQW